MNLPWWSWLIPFYGELVYLRHRCASLQDRVERMEATDKLLRKSLKAWQYNALHATAVPEDLREVE